MAVNWDEFTPVKPVENNEVNWDEFTPVEAVEPEKISPSDQFQQDLWAGKVDYPDRKNVLVGIDESMESFKNAIPESIRSIPSMGIDFANKAIQGGAGYVAEAIDTARKAYDEKDDPKFDAVSTAGVKALEEKDIPEAAKKLGSQTTAAEALSLIPEAFAGTLPKIPANMMKFGLGTVSAIADLLPDPNFNKDDPSRTIWDDLYAASIYMSAKSVDAIKDSAVKSLDDYSNSITAESEEAMRSLSPGDPRKGIIAGTMSAAHSIGAIAAGPSRALKIMFADVAGDELENLDKKWDDKETGELLKFLKDSGYTSAGSLAIASLYGGAEIFGEKIALNKLFGKWGGEWKKELAKFVAIEAGQETATETIQAGLDKITTNPNMTWGEFQDRYKDLYASLPIAIGGMAAAGKGIQYGAAKIGDYKYNSRVNQLLKQAVSQQATNALDPQGTKIPGVQENDIYDIAPGQRDALKEVSKFRGGDDSVDDGAFKPTHKANGGIDVQPLVVNGNVVADTYTDKNKNIIRDPSAVEIIRPTEPVDNLMHATPVGPQNIPGAPKYDINSFDVDAQSAAIKAEVEAGAAAGDARQGIINSVFGAPAEIIPDPVDLSAQQAEINQQIINDAATGTTLPENPQAIETGKRPENIQDQIASIEAEADKAGITDPIEKRQFVIEQLYGESPKPKVKTQAELNEEKIQAAKTGTTRPKTTPKDLSLRYKKADRKQAISLQEQAVDSGLTDISEINQYVIDNATGSVKTQAEKNQIRLNSMATGTIKIADNQTAQYSREQMRKRLPENLQDPRLGREIYRDSLNSLLTDLTPGGGIAVVPDPDYVRGEGDGGAIPMKRTPSLNPDWAQAIMAEESAEMKDLENAVKKALEGKKLGVRQARIVTAMLDQVTGERTDPAVINYVTNARAEAQAARREALGNDAGAEIAGEVYEETEYEMEWSGDNRAFYELYNESVEIDQAQAENIFDENYKTDADLPVIAKLLSERIISNERTIDEKADTQRPEDRAKAEEAEVEKDLVAEARSGDKAAQSKLKEYGLGWDGDKTKYRFINDREVDILLSGKKVNSIRDNNRTDITSTGEESNKGTGDQSSGPDGNNVYRVTFKKTDRFDTDRTGADAILKSESLGDYHLSNGYSIDDVQLVERQNDDGKFEQIYSDAGSKTAEEIASAASEAEGDTATDPQIEADNYKKGRIQNLQGFKIVIENEAGTKRRPEWPPLAHNYGDIAETLGADGDKIDAFVKKGVDIPADNPIYVINQNDQGTSSFDEHKTMFGFSSVDDAKKGYLDSYTADFDGFGSIVEATPEQLKQWIEKGDTTKAYPVDVKAPRGSSTKRDEVSDPTYSNFNGNIIEYEIEIGETGETYTVSADAGQLMRDTDKRIESMEKLMDCVK